MLKRNELISCSMELSSYLISRLDGINRIILHGSVTRGDFDKESDIDLFIDADVKLIDKLNDLVEEFYKSEAFKRWKLKGISNDFSIICGKLDSSEWKELKRAIVNTGILLYGKYSSESDKSTKYSLFVFENIAPDSKRVGFYRKLFGFKANGRCYSGESEKIGALKLGKGVLLVPLAKLLEAKNFFRENKVKLKIYDIWSDEEFT